MDLFESVEDVLRSKITEFVHAECKQYPQLEAQITYVAPGTASKSSLADVLVYSELRCSTTSLSAPRPRESTSNGS